MKLLDRPRIQYFAIGESLKPTEHVAEQVEISIGDARHLPFGDGVFDAVFIAFTLELFEDADIPRVLAQIRRVLRSGGRLGVIAMSKEAQETVMTEIYL